MPWRDNGDGTFSSVSSEDWRDQNGSLTPGAMPPLSALNSPPQQGGQDPVAAIIADLKAGRLGRGAAAQNMAARLLTSALGGNAAAATQILSELRRTDPAVAGVLTGAAQPGQVNVQPGVPGLPQAGTAAIDPTATDPTTIAPPAQLNMLGQDLAFGASSAPWSETQTERNLVWDAGEFDALGRVPQLLWGKFRDPSVESSANAAFQAMRGLSQIPMTQTYSSFLSNPPSMDWRGLINSAVQNLAHNFLPDIGTGALTPSGIQPGMAQSAGMPAFGEPGGPKPWSPAAAASTGMALPAAAGTGAAGTGMDLGGAFQNYLTNNQDLQLQLALASVMPKIPLMLAQSMRNVAQGVFAKVMTSMPQGVPGADPMGTNFLPWFARNNFSFTR